MHYRTIFVIFGLSLLCTASASFLYGQPCSVRNTAYLYLTKFVIPENETNCVDITGCGNPELVNNSAFFQSVWKADTLYADHMNLTTFPVSTVYWLRRLETIDVSGNYIRRLPYKMYKIAPRITKLLIADNWVHVPKKRPILKSASIKMLMLSRNKITNIYPITFTRMPNLEVLYLDGNRLKIVKPDMFMFLSKLLYLHLGTNAIANVPPKNLMPSLLKYYIIRNQRKVIK